MRADHGRIDHLQGGVAQSTSGERFQDHIPDAAIGPSPKLPKDRIPVAKFLRQIAPRRARSHQPKHRSSTQRWLRGGRPPRRIRKGSKYAHSSSVISPRIKAALPQRAALNQFTIPASMDLSTRPSLTVSEVLDVCSELRPARRSKGSATALPREQRSIFVEWSRSNLERAVQAAMAEPRG
jgi:hypothetical protein